MTEESDSDNHLILPALREPEVNFLLRFRVRDIINGRNRSECVTIKQEGLLRMFDVSGVLLCLSNSIE